MIAQLLFIGVRCPKTGMHLSFAGAHYKPVDWGAENEFEFKCRCQETHTFTIPCSWKPKPRNPKRQKNLPEPQNSLDSAAGDVVES